MHKTNDASSSDKNDNTESPSDVYNLDGRFDDEMSVKSISPEKPSSSTPTSQDYSDIPEPVEGLIEGRDVDSPLIPKRDSETDKNKCSEESPLTWYDITIQMGEIEDASKLHRWTLQTTFRSNDAFPSSMHKVWSISLITYSSNLKNFVIF